MTDQKVELTPSEERLLIAMCSINSDLVVRRVEHGFSVNLPRYPRAMTDTREKAEFEQALKSLILKNMIQEAIHFDDQCWDYTLTMAGAQVVNLATFQM